MESIENRVKSIIGDQLGIDGSSIDIEASFNDLGADSFDIVEIVVACESEWGDVDIEDEDINKMVLVSDLVKYIEDKNSPL